MTTILKTKRGSITRIIHGVTLTAAQREVELADMERRESELAYDDRAARLRQQLADDVASFREQKRFDAGRPATEE